MADYAGYWFYSHPPKASYCVASPRRTTAYCLRRRALSETFGGWLYIGCRIMDAITFSALFRSFRRACGGIVATTHVGFWTSENACAPAAHSLQIYDKRCNVCCYASCSVLRSAKRPIFSRSEAKGGDGSGDNKPQRLVVRCAKPMDAEREQGLVRGEAGE